jgi:hypothetical protein
MCHHAEAIVQNLKPPPSVPPRFLRVQNLSRVHLGINSGIDLPIIFFLIFSVSSCDGESIESRH